ncbi:MAG: methyltransferase [Oscillospiraceae bacterium]|nr:methyltransferase [Oscillospiraceae bacterium]
METFFNGYTLQIAPGAFPLSTDSMALAAFVRLPRNARVLDLGSGCGTIGIALCAKDSTCSITGIELDNAAHAAALENAEANRLQDRFHSICGDLTGIDRLTSPGSFDVCVSNPPYFTAGFLSKSTPLARHEQTCTLDTLMKSAAYALKFGGDFYLVHKPERLAEICSAACCHKLEPKRLYLVRHKEGGPVTLVLMQCRKGAKPGLIWEEAALYGKDGQPTEYYKEIYHL